MAKTKPARKKKLPRSLTHDPLGNKRSNQWPKARREHLKREPACQACGGTKVLQVHHCKPFHLHPELELDPGNMLTLCETPARNCHHTWGHGYDWKKFNAQVRRDARWWHQQRIVPIQDSPAQPSQVAA